MRWRAARREERQLAALWFFAAAVGLALRDLWPTAAGLLPHCTFKALTGLPCPTCGTTRAALAMLQGRLVDAFAANPLSAAAGAVFVVGGALAPVWLLLRGPVPEIPHPLPLWIRVGAVGAILATWVYLIAAGI